MEKRKILVVDDQAINRKILGKILESDYNIFYAENGKEAMDILQADWEDISAVLLDIFMPVMNGYEVLELMGKDSRLSQIPVIVSSQEGGDANEVKALSLGAQDFVAKPYKTDIIRQRLSNTIKLRETAAMINRVERDSLTGLFNKNFFMEKVREHLKADSGSHDLLRIDISRFKMVNEVFGIGKGDELLRYMATLIPQLCDGEDVCGYFGSDVFFLLRSRKEQYSNEFFQSFIAQLNEFSINIDLKICVGVYHITNTKIPVRGMCDRAQLAAEQIKGKYDRCYAVYDDSIRQKILDEQFIVNCMQSALEEQQFEVYYQPKYDLNSEMIVGAEALVRWNHPEKGFMSPGAFIPIFEKNGFITELDQYVWEHACKDIRSWLDQGMPGITISVNVSRADIYNPNLSNILLNLVAKYQIPLRYLHLEITESAYTDNPDQIIAMVRKLRDLGFLIEMDDFGSGYSSLNMLAEMPVDVLKLDMRFIQNEAGNTPGRGILSFVISLAKWMDLAVVAEGVETGEQIAALRAMDCNYVQGFYFAKPMRKMDFEELIKSGSVKEMVCTSNTVLHYMSDKVQVKEIVNGKVMLIVDDIELNRAVLASTFESMFQIEERANGKEAWEYLKKNWRQVDVVMLDLLMPVMDGFQLLSRIRSDELMKNLPVIITSQGNENSERRALEMRADDFISKPYNPDILRHRVKNVIANYELQEIKEHLHQEDGIKSVVERRETSTTEEQAWSQVEMLKPYFDVVRLVDPVQTLVCENHKSLQCNLHSCFSVWGKTSRCNNCTSLRALEQKKCINKLEYSKDGLFFVISKYVPYGDTGAVMEMVTKLENKYVEKVLDAEQLHARLNEINRKLESDVLTGVYNRRHMQLYLGDYIENARKQNRDLGIAMIDIDEFKSVNDHFGHIVGDSVIKAVASIIHANIAISKGDFVVRFGGDEFLVVCQGIGPEVFQRRLRSVAELCNRITIDKHPALKVEISFGTVCLSEYPQAEEKQLIEYADERLYQAKHRKNQ